MKEKPSRHSLFQLILNLVYFFNTSNPVIAALDLIKSYFSDGKVWSGKLICFKFNEASYAIFDAI